MTAIDERALEAGARAVLHRRIKPDFFEVKDGAWTLDHDKVVAEAAIRAYLQALCPGSTGETNRCRPISDEPLEALAHARTTASNDDLSKPGTVERERHCERIAAMQAASDEITKLRAMLAAAGGR